MQVKTARRNLTYTTEQLQRDADLIGKYPDKMPLAQPEMRGKVSNLRFARIPSEDVQGGPNCSMFFQIIRHLPDIIRVWRVRQQHPARRKLTINHGDYCRYPTTRRVASSTSVPTASSGSISERCKTAVWASASIDVTHTNAASPKSTLRSSSLWSSRSALTRA